MSVYTHHYQQLIDAFDGCFPDTLNTRLIKGDEEPLYLPAAAAAPYHRIIFAHGYYASALHEIAHWCIAGAPPPAAFIQALHRYYQTPSLAQGQFPFPSDLNE